MKGVAKILFPKKKFGDPAEKGKKKREERPVEKKKKKKAPYC